MKFGKKSLVALSAIAVASMAALADFNHPGFPGGPGPGWPGHGGPGPSYPGPVYPGPGGGFHGGWPGHQHGGWQCGGWRHDGRDAFRDLRDQLQDMVEDGQQAQSLADSYLRSNPDYLTSGRGVDLYLAIYSFTAQAQATYNIAAMDWSGRDQRADVAQAVDNLDRSIQRIRVNNDRLPLDLARFDCDLQDVKAIVGYWGGPVVPPGPPGPPLPPPAPLIRPAHNSASFSANADSFIGILISSNGIMMDPNNNDHDRFGRTYLTPGATLTVTNDPARFPGFPSVGFVNIRNVQVTTRGGRMILQGAPMILGNQISVTFADPQSGGGNGSFVVTWDSDY